MLKIPFLGTPDSPLTSSTQKEFPIADIVSDVVLYKDGGAALVLESTSLNFGLLSEIEQEAVIAAYAALLNSLTYSVQIVVRSQRKDISHYIKYFEIAQSKIANQKLAAIMADYKNFIQEAIRKKNVLSKKFYIVIPFSALELGIAKSFLLATKKKEHLPFTKAYVLNKARITLYPKRDHLIRQAGRLGIAVRQLKTPELIELYYQIFNPQPPAKKAELEFA